MLIVRTNNCRLPEKRYCLEVLLGEFSGLPYQAEIDAQAVDLQIILPNQKRIVFPDTFLEAPDREGIFLPVSTVMEGLVLPHPFRDAADLPVICGTCRFEEMPDGYYCGLDILASSFYMLSRWEEYLSPERDAHGRFPATASLAFRMGFLQRPVVNEYLDLLRDMMARLGWDHPRRRRDYALHISHDVDHPLLWWTPRDRLRTLAGSLLKRGNLPELNYWLRYRGERDPFDTFDELMDRSEQAGIRSHFNFLGKRALSSDCYYPLAHPFTLRLLQKITDRGHLIGFHPSYEAFGNPAAFGAELESLRAVAPQPVETGRQHYLRFAVPHTWRLWENAGMRWDSSLGYADAPGFRCGICYEFPVFDVLRRMPMKLREKPLIAMDVTLALYNGNEPREGLNMLNGLRDEVKKHAGEFVLLWHNSSLNDFFWKDWAMVYRTFLNT